MKKQLRIKKNDEFQAVFKKGRSFANRQFVVYVLHKENQTEFRVGLSVSKKLGNAVKRNQIKRYMRRSLYELRSEIVEHNDYVVIARHPVATMDFKQIKNSLRHVFSVARAIKK